MKKNITLIDTFRHVSTIIILATLLLTSVSSPFLFNYSKLADEPDITDEPNINYNSLFNKRSTLIVPNSVQHITLHDNVSYFPHGPITILSDEDIQNYSFPGSGTTEDPYRIEYLNITTLNTTITIVNTTKSFIIHNCYLATNYYRSVVIANFSMGSITIQSNFFSNRTMRDTCIDIMNCSNINVIGNQFEMGGILALDSHSLLISENTLLTGYIYVRGCKDIQVSSNYCANVHGEISGISIADSDHIVIENNSCTNNELGGIYCGDSTDIKVIGNKCWKNKLYAGMNINSVTNGEIRDNWLSDNIQVNIDIMDNCKSIKIVNNTLINSRRFKCWYGDILGLGIWVDDQATDILIERNEIGRNLVGISIYRLEHAIVRDNFIWSSYIAGIELYNANSTLITYNTLFCNAYGIYCGGTTKGFYNSLTESYNNFIHHNNFIENNPNGSSQAYDAGIDTRWYDPRSHEGNYWSDYNRTKILKEYYYIDGPAESFDPYPLKHSVVYSPRSSFFDYWLFDFSTVFILFVVLTGLPFFWLLAHKKKLR